MLFPHADVARPVAAACPSLRPVTPTLPAWLPPTAIAGAAARLAGLIVRTPTLRAPGLDVHPLDGRSGHEVWCKAETLQATGAFKERGALNRLLRLSAPERARGVVAMSAGNHAAGLALHAQRLGVLALIVMPRTAPRCKVERTRGFGAEVVLAGNSVAEARDTALELAAERRATFVHPYDDPDVIAGQGTVGLEILDEVPDADTVIVPVGGGGLLAGIAAAVKARRPAVRVIGVRHARHAFGRAASGPTLADGIAVDQLGKLARIIVAGLVDDMVTVEEHDVAAAIRALHHRVGMVAEGAGAVAVAALLNGAVKPGRRTVAVLSGRNIDPDTLAHVLSSDPADAVQ